MTRNSKKDLDSWIKKGESIASATFTVQFDAFIADEHKGGRRNKALHLIMRCDGESVQHYSQSLLNENGSMWLNSRERGRNVAQYISEYLGVELSRACEQIGNEADMVGNLDEGQRESWIALILEKKAEEMRQRFTGIGQVYHRGPHKFRLNRQDYLRFVTSYPAFLKIWSEARKVYLKHFKDSDWHNTVRNECASNLDDEMLNWLEERKTTARVHKYKWKPAHIAIVHGARFVGLEANISEWRTLKRVYDEGTKLFSPHHELKF